MMDTSEIYIKMCDCPEVQDGWKVSVGDWYMYEDVHYKEQRLEILGTDDGANLSIFQAHKDENTWLPRQCQLQDMMGDISQIGINVLVNKFYVFCLETTYKEGYLTTAHFETMEQLWLAYYMFEKHKKAWNGEKWIDK